MVCWRSYTSAHSPDFDPLRRQENKERCDDLHEVLEPFPSPPAFLLPWHVRLFQFKHLLTESGAAKQQKIPIMVQNGPAFRIMSVTWRILGPAASGGYSELLALIIFLKHGTFPGFLRPTSEVGGLDRGHGFPIWNRPSVRSLYS